MPSENPGTECNSAVFEPKVSPVCMCCDFAVEWFNNSNAISHSWRKTTLKLALARYCQMQDLYHIDAIGEELPCQHKDGNRVARSVHSFSLY